MGRLELECCLPKMFSIVLLHCTEDVLSRKCPIMASAEREQQKSMSQNCEIDSLKFCVMLGSQPNKSRSKWVV